MMRGEQIRLRAIERNAPRRIQALKKFGDWPKAGPETA